LDEEIGEVHFKLAENYDQEDGAVEPEHDGEFF
jgi:hypothetical protein